MAPVRARGVCAGRGRGEEAGGAPRRGCVCLAPCATHTRRSRRRPLAPSLPPPQPPARHSRPAPPPSSALPPLAPPPHGASLSRHAQSGPRARAVTPCTAPAVRFEAEDPRAQAKALGPRSALPPTRGGASRPPSSSLPHPARMHRRGGAGGRGGGGQRTLSFDCLHFPTLSQRCPRPGRRRHARGCPPAHPPPPPAAGVRRSRIRWFTKSCVSHDVSQLAALFIDA